MRPVNVVDGIGFLQLTYVAEPRYVVTCIKTLMKSIDQRYHQLKHTIHGQLAQQKSFTLTTNMWTSRRGDAYISLTSHFLKSNFEMLHQNLRAHHLPGITLSKDCYSL